MGIRQRGRPVHPNDLKRLRDAVAYLRAAAYQCRHASAHHAAAYCRRALKSVEGAIRNAEGHALRERSGV